MIGFVLAVATCSPAVAGGPGDETDGRANFVVHGAGPQRAAAILGHAERLRADAFSQLLDEPSPRPWTVRCVIHVHPAADSFEEAVGGGPESARGATSLDFAGERVISRRIDVMGDGPDIVPDALAHELVHVVLADHFVHAPPPRWADEGLALLFDGDEKQREHAADFRDALRRGVAWPADDLLELEHYPEGSLRQRVFYGQSAALVRWLVARGGAAAFIRFIDDGHDIGWSRSFERHYRLTAAEAMRLASNDVLPIARLSLAEAAR